MTTIYTRSQATAKRLLGKYAQGQVVLTRPGAPTPGANEWDQPTPGGDTSWTLSATVKGVSAKFINKDTVLATDLEVIAADFGDAPQPSDVLTVDGKAMTVIQTMRIPSAGTLVAWRFIVRS